MVEIRLQDYRDVGETFDHIASIEMFEAVGERYWPVFFSSVRDRLRAGGSAALQVITIADDRFDALPAERGLHPEVHLPRRHAARPEGLRRRWPARPD